MDRFERQLHQALRRVDPPPGFAEAVIGRAAAEPKPGRWRGLAGIFQMPARRWAVATVAGLVLLAGIGYEREMRRRQGELASRQVIEALEITAEQFQIARRHVQRLSAVWETAGEGSQQ